MYYPFTHPPIHISIPTPTCLFIQPLSIHSFIHSSKQSPTHLFIYLSICHIHSCTHPSMHPRQSYRTFGKTQKYVNNKYTVQMLHELLLRNYQGKLKDSHWVAWESTYNSSLPSNTPSPITSLLYFVISLCLLSLSGTPTLQVIFARVQKPQVSWHSKHYPVPLFGSLWEQWAGNSSWRQ